MMDNKEAVERITGEFNCRHCGEYVLEPKEYSSFEDFINLLRENWRESNRSFHITCQLEKWDKLTNMDNGEPDEWKKTF